MRRRTAPYRFALLLLAAASLTPALGPAVRADICDGISDVSDFDGSAVSDLDGSLDTIKVGTNFTRPTFVTAPPGDTHRLFILEQDGTIRIVKDGTVLATPFLDISSLTRSPADGGGDEQGLLGMAFDPNYATSRRFFIYHTNTNSMNPQNLVVRYQADASNPDIADTSTRTQIIAFSHPTFTNHNGGMIAFAPDDGYLYIGTGDGGSACDPGSGAGNAQTLTSNLGKLLRLDVSGATYTNPPDNPFVGQSGNDEIWSYGLRNPWRFSFDRANSNLMIADVGQDNWEELDCRLSNSAGGENYGWVEYEGTHCNPNPSCSDPSDCVVSGTYVGPILEYCHATANCPSIGYAGRSITGGYVYRGCRMGDLAGTYFYGDYVSSWVRTIRTNNACPSPNPSQILNRTNDLSPGAGGSANSITSFGEDAQGEIYICRRGTSPALGEVYKIVPALRILEVSANRAPRFLLSPSVWSWEDVTATSSQPVSLYRLYRSTAGPTGPFTCLHQGATNTWSGGDPGVPPPGTCWFYLVTARNAGGEETRPGSYSDGTPRSVDVGSSCPL